MLYVKATLGGSLMPAGRELNISLSTRLSPSCRRPMPKYCLPCTPLEVSSSTWPKIRKSKTNADDIFSIIFANFNSLGYKNSRSCSLTRPENVPRQTNLGNWFGGFEISSSVFEVLNDRLAFHFHADREIEGERVRKRRKIAQKCAERARELNIERAAFSLSTFFGESRFHRHIVYTYDICSVLHFVHLSFWSSSSFMVCSHNKTACTWPEMPRICFDVGKQAVFSSSLH